MGFASVLTALHAAPPTMLSVSVLSLFQRQVIVLEDLEARRAETSHSLLTGHYSAIAHALVTLWVFRARLELTSSLWNATSFLRRPLFLALLAIGFAPQYHDRRVLRSLSGLSILFAISCIRKTLQTNVVGLSDSDFVVHGETLHNILMRVKPGHTSRILTIHTSCRAYLEESEKPHRRSCLLHADGRRTNAWARTRWIAKELRKLNLENITTFPK